MKKICLILLVFLSFSCKKSENGEEKGKTDIIIFEHKDNYTPSEKGERCFHIKWDMTYDQLVNLMGEPSEADWESPSKTQLIYHYVCIKGKCKYVMVHFDKRKMTHLSFRKYHSKKECCN